MKILLLLPSCYFTPYKNICLTEELQIFLVFLQDMLSWPRKSVAIVGFALYVRVSAVLLLLIVGN
jgi:hypothetical protein